MITLHLVSAEESQPTANLREFQDLTLSFLPLRSSSRLRSLTRRKVRDREYRLDRGRKGFGLRDFPPIHFQFEFVRFLPPCLLHPAVSPIAGAGKQLTKFRNGRVFRRLTIFLRSSPGQSGELCDRPAERGNDGEKDEIRCFEIRIFPSNGKSIPSLDPQPHFSTLLPSRISPILSVVDDFVRRDEDARYIQRTPFWRFTSYA